MCIFKNRRNSSTRVSSALSPSTVEPMTTASASLSASTLSLDLPILEENPYAGHPELSGLEASVLWEYAKMAGIVKQLAATTRNLANTPANDLLATMRTVESQMGLVLTLFKASVWSTIVSAESDQGRRGTDHEDVLRRSEFRRDGSSAHARSASADQQRDESFYSDDVTPQPRYR
ncbi:hypothetical protein FRB98_002266, partial [Tulasnella sp. 332]